MTIDKLAKFTAPQGWSELPEDQLITIANKITDIADYIHFRGVCPSWRAAAKPQKSPPELPWLLLPYDPESPTRHFFSRSASRIYNFQCPEIKGKVVCGSSHGWLALVSPHSSLSLWNPINRAEIILPPLTLPPSTCFSSCGHHYCPHRAFAKTDVLDEYCCTELFPEKIHKGHPWRVSLSCNPNRGADCVVVVVLADTTNFAYCRIGDEYWTVLDTTFSSYVNCVVFLDDKFCAMDWEGNCEVLDLGTNPPRTTPIELHDNNGSWIRGYYLLNVAEDVFMIHGFVHCDEENEDMEVFEVWKLDMVEKKWVQQSSIVDLAIFLSGNHASAVRTSDFPECRGNRIYFNQCESDVNSDRLTRGKYFMDIFRLKDDKFGLSSFRWSEVLEGPRSATWLTTSLC